MALMSRTIPSSQVCDEIVQFRSGYSLNFGMVNHVGAAKMRLNFLSSTSSSCPTRTPRCLHAGSASIGCKRRSQFTVAASPPTEDVAVAAEPLTKEDLIGYLASGCKPKEKWRYHLLHLRCICSTYSYLSSTDLIIVTHDI